MIGYRISKIRTENLRKTTQHMADATGIDRALLQAYENDGVIPTDDHLQLIADYLGVTKERLLGTDIDISKYNIYGRGMTDEEIEDLRDTIREMKKSPFRWEAL